MCPLQIATSHHAGLSEGTLLADEDLAVPALSIEFQFLTRTTTTYVETSPAGA